MRSVANLTRRDGEELLALAPRVPVRTEVEVFPLEQANEALDRLRRGQIRGAAVLRVESMSRLKDVVDFASRHRRLLGALQLIGILLIFFSALGWGLRGSVQLSRARPPAIRTSSCSSLGCAGLGVYYLVFVVGWMWILREWGVRASRIPWRCGRR